MSLYPSVLFHFTDKFPLYYILDGYFKVSYAREKLTSNINEYEFAIPMVSFCDLKMSELKNHIEKYGRFGVGLSKDWAIRSGLNPVSYVNAENPRVEQLINRVSDLCKIVEKPHERTSIPNDYFDVLNACSYTKNYQGDLVRNEDIIKDYRFADEREWRFVPIYQDGQSFAPILSGIQINTSEKKQVFNKDLSQFELKFAKEDVCYIIVENEDERESFIWHFEKLQVGFTDIYLKLISRIITCEQIIMDM